MRKKVLFICIHNSARSQMAEAFLNQMCGNQFDAYSAGLEPGTLNPLVVKAMQEIGVDISGHKTKSVSDILNSGKSFAYVITVCDETSAERCPVFPGATTRLHWGFPDPSALQGSHDEKLARTREIRDAIKARVEEWCAQVCSGIPARESPVRYLCTSPLQFTHQFYSPGYPGTGGVDPGSRKLATRSSAGLIVTT